MYTGRVGRPVHQDLDLHRQGAEASLYQDLDVHRQVVEASLPGPACTQAVWGGQIPGPGCTGSGWKGLIFSVSFKYHYQPFT